MFYKIAATILYPLVMLLFRVKVIGREKIPEGAAVLCANHSSLWDPVLIGVCITAKHPLSFMAKKELFDKPVLGFLIRHLGAFPVERDSADLGTIRKSIEVLKSGKKLLLFPEGRRVQDEHLEEHEVKTGVAMIAVRAGVPIVPIYLSGNKKIFRRAVLSIGDPILPEKREGSHADNYKRIAGEAFHSICVMEEANR